MARGRRGASVDVRRRARSGGAQPGHSGNAREPTPAEDVDDVVDHEPDRCTRCGHDELVAFGAPHPIGVPRSKFGPRLHAVVTDLLAGYRMSRREVSSWLAEHCGVRASIGGVGDMKCRMSDALKKPCEAALTSGQSSPVLNVDETPWKLGDQLHWLWTAVGERVAVHRIHRRRNREAMRSLIGERFAGLLVTDRLATYDESPAGRRQLCWTHLERDFRALTQGPRDCRDFGETGLDIA